MLIDDFPDTIRVLSDAHKKTPGPRLDLFKTNEKHYIR